jgi:hypothetical protein
MVKIIDYGRSFFPYAEKYHEQLCQTKDCAPSCGDESGFTFLNKDGSLRDQFYIWSKKHNQSHDLRLLTIIKGLIKTHKSVEINNKYAFLDKVKFKDPFGTPEIKKSGLPQKINNVSDAFAEIKTRVIPNDDKYTTSTQIGVLHIYLDSVTPMRFVPEIP